MNKGSIKRSFSRCLNTYNRQASVQEDICVRLVEHYLKLNALRGARLLEIGCGTGLLTRKLSLALDWERLWINDLVPEVEPMIRKSIIPPNKQWEFIGGDVETIEFPGRLDLVISGSTFQWITNLEGLFAKIANSLSTGGYLIFNTFGADNLKEIRLLTNNGLNYYALPEIERLLNRHFNVTVATEETKRLMFSSPKEVINHLRETGVNGLTQNRWTKQDYRDFKNRYLKEFSTPEGIPLSYHPMIFVAQKPPAYNLQSLPEKHPQPTPLEAQQ